MKRVIVFVIGMLCIGIGFSAYAQDTKEQSKTKSALCTAQAETFKLVFDSLYNIDKKVDVNNVYKNAISSKTAECLAADLKLWGKAVIANAQEGKFKEYRLSFEKPADSKFKVPAKAKRTYKRAFKEAKKEFISNRKSTTLDKVLEDKYLQKYLAKTNKAFIKQKDSYLKKIVK